MQPTTPYMQADGYVSGLAADNAPRSGKKNTAKTKERKSDAAVESTGNATALTDSIQARVQQEKERLKKVSANAGEPASGSIVASRL